jgi:glycosyltransferase involved in cell wall biosynthesis
MIRHLQKLAIISTHPIQYNAPLFRLLHQRSNITVKVFYTWSQSEKGTKFDPGFGKEIKWDIPLLEGYDYCFVNNISDTPGSHHYKGIDNPTLIQEIQKWDANAILVYGWNFKSHLKVIRFFKNKVPVLFRGDSTLMNECFGIKQIARRLFLKYIYSNIDIALYVGEANKKYFLAHGLKNNQLHFMPHAIDNKRFEQTKKLEDAAMVFRNENNIPLEAILFLYAGKLDENKNIFFLANTFGKLNNVKAHLLIVGNGKTESTLKRNFSINKNIHFVDFQNQQTMPLVYAVGDIFILPSKSETWGLCLNEAMAAGKAIVATHNCGASIDLIEDGKNGFVFGYNDEYKLIQILKYFIENKNIIKDFGTKSLEKVSLFSYLNDAKALEDILYSVLNN